MSRPEKEIVLDVTDGKDLDGLLRQAKDAGISRVITRRALPKSLDGVTLIHVSDSAASEKTAAWLEIDTAEDVQKAVRASELGHAFVVVQCNNWKIIPLENLIAEFRRRKEPLYAFMKDEADIRLAFSILERGVDGIVIPAEALPVAKQLRSSLMNGPAFPVATAKVTKIVDAGVGERACVDTASQLSVGEGMLIGSKGSFFFLVHSETVPSEYIPTRPFRVNAGAIHSYVLGTNGKTRYLSELEGGDTVQVVTSEGVARDATVGRVKIERRPLVMVVAKVGDQDGSVLLQKAETIRLVRKDGSPVPVTDLKVGDEVIVHLEGAAARHFGGAVDEFILER